MSPSRASRDILGGAFSRRMKRPADQTDRSTEQMEKRTFGAVGERNASDPGSFRSRRVDRESGGGERAGLERAADGP